MFPRLHIPQYSTLFSILCILLYSPEYIMPFIKRHLKYCSNGLLNVSSTYHTIYSKKGERCSYSVVLDPNTNHHVLLPISIY